MVLPAQFVNVIVVGAGLSGLRAATEIHDAGLSYVVLEAMDRVGGKTLSVQASSNGTAVVDLGAAWINDSNQSEMYAMAKEFGFDLVVQRTEGLSISQDDKGQMSLIPYGMPANLTSEQLGELSTFAQGMQQYIDRSDLENPHLGQDAVKLDSMTALEFVQSEFPAKIATTFTYTLVRALLGVDPEEVSALYLIDFIKSGTGLLNISSDTKHGAQYLRNRQGNQNFAKKLASKLEPNTVQLSSAVKSITQAADHCIVRTQDDKVYVSKKVLLSVPTSLIPQIEFTPRLPEPKRILTQSTKLGYYSKTVLVYSEPWWRHANLSGVFSSIYGPISFTRDTCVPEMGQFSLTCFHTGETGRQWSKLDAKGRRKAVLDQFHNAFGTAVESIPEPINVIEKEWTKDPWAQGNPNPVMMPGLMTSAAGQSIRDRYGHVHFIGTETSYVWKGYMEGAVLSGIRGAKEVIAALQRNETATQQPTSIAATLLRNETTTQRPNSIAATLQRNETATSNMDQRPSSAAATPEYTGSSSSVAATPEPTGPYSAVASPEYTGPYSAVATPEFTKVVASGLDRRPLLAC
ncbi:hypothetical protein ACQRIT_001045 [Beauveria bassiana]